MKEGYIFIHNCIFPVKFAITQEQQERGLMYLEPPVPNMAFLYKNSKINKFWMKSTPAPLDIIFCYQGKISQICYGEPYSTSVIGNNSLSDLVLEFPYGTMEQLQLKIGHSVGLIS